MNTVCKVPAGSQKNFQESLPGKIEKVIVNAVLSRDQPHEKVQTKRLRQKSRGDGIYWGNRTPFIRYPDLDCNYFLELSFIGFVNCLGCRQYMLNKELACSGLE